MFRPTARHLLKSSASRITPKAAQSRRLLSTAPPHQRSRSWKSSAIRWGLAGTLVYYYNTTNAFADEPAYAVHLPPTTRDENEDLPTLEQIAAQKQAQNVQAVPAATTIDAQSPTNADVAAPGSPEDLEEEAGQQGAFNEETGEINWDCPCLGGMAHGPCGEEFRAAFSCFVYSKEEQKGIDCIDKFKGMQDCFRQHPDVYGAELEDEENAAPPADAASPVADESSPSEGSSPPSLSNMNSSHGGGAKVADLNPNNQPDHPSVVQGKTERAEAATQQVKDDHVTTSESEEMVPKAWHDSK